MKHVGKLAAAAAALILTAPAQATLLTFTITGDYSATFQIDSNPVPDVAYSGLGFTVWDVPGFPDAFFGIADITFFSSSIGGGLSIEDFFGGSYLLVTDGPQLYTGSEDTPTIITGTFALTEYLGNGTYTLTIAAPAVPEPASWAMMIGGFAIAGGAMRRKAQTIRFA